MLSDLDKWNMYFLVWYYPIFGIREVSLECGLKGRALKTTLENLIRIGYIQEIGEGKFRFRVGKEKLEEMLKDLNFKDWELDDCWKLYRMLDDQERKILNRITYTSSSVGVGVIMKIVGSRGYFKILSFFRKVCTFSRENCLKVPIRKEILNGKNHILVCDDNFRENMLKVLEATL